MYQIVLVTFVTGEYDHGICTDSYNNLISLLPNTTFSTLKVFNLGSDE